MSLVALRSRERAGEVVVEVRCPECGDWAEPEDDRGVVSCACGWTPS